MGFDEYEVRRTSVKVFLAGLILAVLLSIILHSISYCVGFVLGYLIDLLILQINMKMTDTILSIQTAGKTISSSKDFYLYTCIWRKEAYEIMKITIQPELISSLIVTVLLSIFFVYAGKKTREADPTKRPKGVVLLVETAIKMVYDYMGTIMPKKYAKNYYPYFSMLFAWLLVSNLFGLTGFDAPTTNYSITLSLTLITWVLIQINAIKYQGVGSYIKGTLIPPTNLFGLVSPLISISMRIFCNLLSGTFIMALVYQATSFLSYKLIPFNFLGPVVAPLLHCYFDVFSGCVQALVFVTLSSILISNENPDEE